MEVLYLNSIEYRELCEEMQKLAINKHDPEKMHIKADALLCDALKKLNCDLLVELYEQVTKFYI